MFFIYLGLQTSPKFLKNRSEKTLRELK